MTSLVPGAAARIANLIATFVPFLRPPSSFPKPVVMYNSVSIPYDYCGLWSMAWSWWQKNTRPNKVNGLKWGFCLGKNAATA